MDTQKLKAVKRVHYNCKTTTSSIGSLQTIMETLKELFSSMRDWFSERVGNPLFASFVAAWLVLNWRVVLVLFSDMTPLEKITWLDSNLYPAWWHWTYYGLIAPLATSITYLTLSPYILRKVSVYWRTQQHKSTEAMLEADKIQPVSPELAQRLIRERINARVALKQEQVRFGNLEDDYLDQIEKLQEQLKKSNLKANQSSLPIEAEPNLELKEIANKLSSRAIELLDTTCNSENGMITIVNYIDGSTGVNIGNRGIISEDASKREVAAWLAAIEELENHSIIKSNNNNKNGYVVSQRGYDVHDILLESVLTKPSNNNYLGKMPLGGAPLGGTHL